MPVTNYYEWDNFGWDTFAWDADVLADGWTVSTTGDAGWSQVSSPVTTWS